MTIRDCYLTPNEYSRPGKKLKEVKGIVLHWVANPGTSAEANRKYFENRKKGATGYGSAHYIVDLDGTVISCMPEIEMAYHVGANEYTPYSEYAFGTYPNNCTIGIELCHPTWEGEFTGSTLLSAEHLCSWLCGKYRLNPYDAITTHYAITGKLCPKWFVHHPGDLTRLKIRVRGEM